MVLIVHCLTVFNMAGWTDFKIIYVILTPPLPFSFCKICQSYTELTDILIYLQNEAILPQKILLTPEAR